MNADSDNEESSGCMNLSYLNKYRVMAHIKCLLRVVEMMLLQRKIDILRAIRAQVDSWGMIKAELVEI
jgi:hypothetical protein